LEELRIISSIAISGFKLISVQLTNKKPTKKTNKTFKPNLNNHYIYSKKFKDYLVISKSINQLFYKLY